MKTKLRGHTHLININRTYFKGFWERIRADSGGNQEEGPELGRYMIEGPGLS